MRMDTDYTTISNPDWLLDQDPIQVSDVKSEVVCVLALKWVVKMVFLHQHLKRFLVMSKVLIRLKGTRTLGDILLLSQVK